MSVNEALPSYSEISADAYATAIDAVEASGARTLDYVKSAWGIFARPYPSTAIEAVLGENALRASAFVSLTLEAMQTNNRVAAELAREGARIVASAQESYVTALRGVAETGVSNLAFIKNAAATLQPQNLPVPNFN